MKKLIFTFLCLILITTAFCGVMATTYAEESGIIVDETSEVITEAEPVDEVKAWVDKFFSPESVAMYVSWIAYIGTVFAAVGKVVGLKKQNSLTLENVKTEVSGLLEKTISKEVAQMFNDFIPKLITTQEKANSTMTIFAKILALSQENTPESRVAILNLIQELGVVGKDIIDNSIQMVEQGKAIAEQSKADIDNKIDEIIENNTYDGTSI